MKEAVELMLQNGADVTAKDFFNVKICLACYVELVENLKRF